MPHSLRQERVHGSLPFSQNLPVRSVLILLPWKRPSIHKQVKWPLDLPLMPVVIVSPDDTLSQQKLKLIPASGVEDDDSRPEWSRQQPGDQPPVRQGLIKGMQQRRHATVKDASPTKPAACQPALQPARDLPPLLTTPRGHHPAFNALWLQEKSILLGVVVTECGYACGGHTDNAVYDRLISLRWQKKGHIANAQGPAVIRHDLHDLRLAQSRIHAGADISSEEHGPGDIPVTILQRHCRS